jgi:succinate-acetate transporter protein
MAEVRIVVRPYASSLPLGFFAFGIGMLLLGGLANGWLHPSDRHTVGLILAAFVFPLELLATVVAFVARDAFGGTGLGLFSTSWLALGLANMSASQDAVSRTVGLYEFGFAFAVGLLAVAAFAGKPLIGAIMLVAAVRSSLSGVHEWGGPAALYTAAGWLGGRHLRGGDVRRHRVPARGSAQGRGAAGAPSRLLEGVDRGRPRRAAPAARRRGRRPSDALSGAAAGPAPSQGRKGTGLRRTAVFVREGSDEAPPWKQPRMSRS